MDGNFSLDFTALDTLQAAMYISHLTGSGQASANVAIGDTLEGV